MRSARAWAFGLIVCVCSAAVCGATAQVSLQGHVQGPMFEPISGARLSFSQASELIDSAVSMDQGAYSLSLAPDVYDLTIQPAPGSAFGLYGAYRLSLTADTELDVLFGRMMPEPIRAAATPEVSADTRTRIAQTELVSYSGHIVDRAGAAFSGVQVLVFSDDIYSTHADENGAFELSAAPLLSSVAVACGDMELCPGDTDHTQSISLSYPQVDLSCGPVRDQRLVIENRKLVGTIKEGCGGPLAGVTVSWQQWDVHYGKDIRGSTSDHVLTDEHGHFEISVLPGAGQLSASFVGRTDYTQATMYLSVPETAADPKPVELELWPVPPVEMVRNRGRVVDSQRRGLAYARVRLGGRDHSDLTDELGAFEIEAPRGSSSFEVYYCWQDRCNFEADTRKIELKWPSGAFGAGPFDGVEIVIDTRTISGSVVDSAGNFVSKPRVYWSQQFVSFDDHMPEGVLQDFALPQDGKFSLLAVAGPSPHIAGYLQVHAGDDLHTYLAVEAEHIVTKDFSYLIVLPRPSSESTPAAGGGATTLLQAHTAPKVFAASSGEPVLRQRATKTDAADAETVAVSCNTSPSDNPKSHAWVVLPLIGAAALVRRARKRATR